MILAVDIGIATCGWAVVRQPTGEVIDLGVIITQPSVDLGIQADRVSRIQLQSVTLHEVIIRHCCRAMAVESLSFPRAGGVTAAASVCLSMGSCIALATAHAIRLYTVPPKTWQHAVSDSKGKVDYAGVLAKLHSYVENSGGFAAAQLLCIPRSRRSHPLDAVAVGVYAARNFSHLDGGFV